MESGFDALAKALASGMSRRDVLRKIGGSALGATLAYFGVACADDPTSPTTGNALRPLFGAGTGRCKKGGHKCRQNSECCTGFCEPATGRCVCPVGTNMCPATGLCITCSGLFNPVTCQCECDAAQVCGSLCCPEGSRCCLPGCGLEICSIAGECPC